MRIFICLQVTMLALLAVSLKAIAVQEEPRPVTIYSHPKPIAKVEPNGEFTFSKDVKPEDVMEILYKELISASKQMQNQAANCDDIIRRKDLEIAKLTPKPTPTPTPTPEPQAKDGNDAVLPPATGSKEKVQAPSNDQGPAPKAK